MLRPEAPVTQGRFGKKGVTAASATSAASASVAESASAIRKFTTDAEAQWYAMMASKAASDSNWAGTSSQKLNETTAITVAAKVPVMSPHRPTTFRIPGSLPNAAPVSRSVAMPAPGKGGKGDYGLMRGKGLGKGGKGLPLSKSVSAHARDAPRLSSEVARMMPGGRQREVNSKLEFKSVPGRVLAHPPPRAGPHAPPAMHPAALMRRTDGRAPRGARPPMPIAMAGRPRGMPPPGPPPGRPRPPLSRGPPPEVLARLRARGPPPHSPMHSPKVVGAKAGAAHSAEAKRADFKDAAAKEADAAGTRDTGAKEVGHASTSAVAPLPASVSAANGNGVAPSKDVPSADDSASEAVVHTDRTEHVKIDHMRGNVDNSGAVAKDEVDEFSGGGWIQMWDEEVLSNYYYNSATGEASWIRPESYRDYDGHDENVMDPGAEGGHSAGDEGEAWERYWDDAEGAFYMHNPSTGETRWAEGDYGYTDIAEPK